LSYLFIRRPSEEKIERALAAQGRLSFSYPQVGATREGARPKGYPVNRIRGRVGEGAAGFEAAARALASWAMYATGWTWVRPAGAQTREGELFGVVVRHFSLWSLNACRVVYTLREEGGQVWRAGFAIGTLPGHVERGEERFTVEWDRETGAVTYELFAFARPKPWLLGLAYPFARPVQRRFAADSLGAMRRAVSGPEEP
jgi:uncharacterized protein (UPF0548 family)